MLKRFLILVFFIGQFSAAAAEDNPIKKIEGPVLTLRFAEMSDRGEGSYSYVTRLNDGRTSIHSLAVVFRKQDAFEKKLAALTDELGDPVQNHDEHKIWKSSDDKGESVTTLIFTSPFSRGGPSAQTLSRIASLTEFNKIVQVFPTNYNFDDDLMLLNKLLKAHPDIKMVSMQPEEASAGKFTSYAKVYHLTR